MAIRRAIDAGEIGDVRQVVITSRDPGLPPRDYVAHSGGIFRDMVIHDFDTARFLLGEEPVEVFATASRLVDRELVAAYDDYDTVVVVLRTASGRQCVINCCREAAYGYDQRVEVFGSEGLAASENPLAHTGIVRSAEGTREAELPYFYLERYTASYVHEWEAFVAALVAGETTPVTTADARAPLVIGLAAWRSLREGRPVRLDEVTA
jgi:myo-inositol 2-dehydrogenase/D-chiro-inositol 1-dehydrogenase